jgi:hypothetical protein
MPRLKHRRVRNQGITGLDPQRIDRRNNDALSAFADTRSTSLHARKPGFWRRQHRGRHALGGVFKKSPALAPSVISKEAPYRTIGSHENLRAD